MFEKYNIVLRGLDAEVPALRHRMVLLCCGPNEAEAFDASERGPAEYERAREGLNLYTTTLHAINSAIVKLGALLLRSCRAAPLSMPWKDGLFTPITAILHLSGRQADGCR